MNLNNRRSQPARRGAAHHTRRTVTRKPAVGSVSRKASHHSVPAEAPPLSRPHNARPANAKRRRTLAKNPLMVFNKKTMYRLRHTIQLVIILVCLAWGGYQITSGVLATTDEPATNASTIAGDSQALQAQYPGLPSGVAAAVRSVVATQRITSNTSGDVQSGLAGSGVIINDAQILTAGHNVEDGKGLACEQTLVLAPGALTRASASKEIVTYASVEYGKDDDIAVLTVSGSANFKDLADVSIAERLPQAGETVFFINYQPAGDGTGRSPFAKDAAYTEPAIFSATVLGTSERRFAVAVGGGESYGQGIADTLLRKGASGGAIVNSKGELVGLSVASSSLAANRDAASIAKEYGVELPAKNYQVAFMQQVDNGLVGRLQTGMVSCGGSGN